MLGLEFKMCAEAMLQGAYEKLQEDLSKRNSVSQLTSQKLV